MLPVENPTKTYRTLKEIRLRKEELIEQLHVDNKEFTSLWHELFVSKKNSTKGEFLTSVIGNSISAIDALLLIRKLMKNYRGLFGKKKK